MKGINIQKIIGTVAASLFGSAVCTAAPVQWTSGSGGNDHWYQVVPAAGIDWPSARADALGLYYLALEGHLATVTSQGELSFIDSVVAAQGFGEMYVGGYQNPSTELNPQAGWTWVNGEGTFPGVNSTAPFAQWNPAEPNDFYGPASEQYLGVNLSPGAFNDEGNTANIYGYVVEYDPNTINDVPDAGTTAPLLGGAFALMAMLSRRLRK